MKLKCGSCGVVFKSKFVRPSMRTGERFCPACGESVDYLYNDEINNRGADEQAGPPHCALNDEKEK